MVKSLLVFSLLFSFRASADIFGFGPEAKESKLPALIEKLKNLDMKQGSQYEESFNLAVKAIENGVEEEKLYCAGEAADAEGKTLPASQKQLCMRELKKHYTEANTTIFNLKKKYLSLIHQRQIQKLDEIQNKLKADIEKNF